MGGYRSPVPMSGTGEIPPVRGPPLRGPAIHGMRLIAGAANKLCSRRTQHLAILTATEHSFWPASTCVMYLGAS